MLYWEKHLQDTKIFSTRVECERHSAIISEIRKLSIKTATAGRG